MKLFKLMVLVFVLGLSQNKAFGQTDQADSLRKGPAINFLNSDYDFGVVEMGTVVRYRYEFENVGDAPLIVMSAKAGCGCTQVEFEADTLEPGSKGYFTMIFDTKNRLGMDGNSVTLLTNTPKRYHRVRFKGEIIRPKKKAFEGKEN